LSEELVTILTLLYKHLVLMLYVVFVKLRPLTILQFWMKFASMLLFSTLIGAIFGALLAADGSPAIGNSALVEFMFSGVGLLSLLIVPLAYLVVIYLEHSCILLVLADPKGRVTEAILYALCHLPRIILLALIQTTVVLLCLAPFVAVASFIYWFLLSDADINFYLANKPPKFLIACLLGVVLLFGMLTVLLWLLLRWFHALPRLMFESGSVISALHRSWRQGTSWNMMAACISLWLILQLVSSTLVLIGLSYFTDYVVDVIDHSPSRSVIAASSLLLINSLVLSVIAAVNQTWFVAGLWATYPSLPKEWHEIRQRSVTADKTWIRSLVFVLAGAAALVTLGLSSLYKTIQLTKRQDVRVVAHRAGTVGTPENSLSGLRKSMRCGADAAEIDVQMSRDGTIFVTHDKDLRRMAGLPLVITESSDADLQKADIGLFSKPPLPSEGLATLEEFLQVAQNRFCLSIELKYYSYTEELANKVIELLRKYPSTVPHEIISLEYKALQQVAKLDPTLRRGFLVSASVGDVTQLDVDFISVSQLSFDARLQQKAESRGMKIAVWTVDDRQNMFRLMVAGADDIVTNDPETAVQIVKEYREMDELKLILVRLREVLSDN
jgi:glycerophosphoryl diester phosphodiesterase